MAKITILGGGTWGVGLSRVITDNGHDLIIWSKIEKDDYLSAMKDSPIDSKPLTKLLKEALTADIDNREIFMKGIDNSYYYEEK